ncbi:uncharacterized protein LOC144017495 [Festucalex cinctus]
MTEAHWAVDAVEKSDNPMSMDSDPSVQKHGQKRRELDWFNITQKRKQARNSSAPAAAATAAAAAVDIPPLDCPKEGINPPAGSKILTEEFAATSASLEPEFQALENQHMLFQEEIDGIGLNEMSLQNDDKVKTLTGLPTVSLLMTLFHFVAPFLKPQSDMTSFQQYMLTLIKLRMNLSFDFLAYYFDIESATVSKLFKHCINVMYRRLVPCLVIWPDRESLKYSLPSAFRNSIFEKTVCIIDSLEIVIEKPSSLLASAECHTAFKSQHTMKYLIAFCPQGSICFISNGWGGRTSDKFITEQSNFLRHLLRGDLVLANQCFNVSQSVQSHQAEMKIPAFTRGKKQLDPVNLVDTSCLPFKIRFDRISCLLCQKYKILQSTLPVDFTDVDTDDVTYLDKIVHICSGLMNVSQSVVSF